jgi:hypothetical protein
VYKENPGKAAIKLLTSLYSSLYIQLHKGTSKSTTVHHCEDLKIPLPTDELLQIYGYIL